MNKPVQPQIPEGAASLPAAVQQVVVRNGRVYVLAQPDQLAKGMALALGGSRARFVPMTDADLARAGLGVAYQPDIDGFKAAQDDTAAVMLNALADWKMADQPTFQVQVRDKSGPHRIALTRIEVPAHPVPFTFQAGLAVHRATGRLHVGTSGKGAADTELAFDPEFAGGPDPARYRLVSCPIPASPEPQTVTLSISFDSFTDDSPDRTPFFFVAAPRVHLPQGGACDTLISAARDVANPVWSMADLPRLMDKGDQLRLLVDDRESVLKTAGDMTIAMTEDFGHTVMMQATPPGPVRVYLDGTDGFDAYLGTAPSPVHFPATAQTGQVRRLAVYDTAETQLLFSDDVLVPRLQTPLAVIQAESRAPFPGPLMPQAGFRYDALRAALARGLGADAQAQIAHALSVLEGGHGNVRLDPLSFAQPDAPEVSIVIPAHNNINVTYLALCSLLLAQNKTTFEVIIVDDGSSDETARLESFVSGITIVRNETPQRFIRACNAGVAQARGTYVALLNNDVEVTNGWLDALVDAFSRFGSVGLVGSKLLYPDGRLQDAGGIVWQSGNPWNYGNGQNPWDPRFCHARQVDYLSGAALMTTRAIWDSVGGLSSDMEPMYFEDTDLAFKIRDAGYTTWFVPSSVVYHYEGMTSGTDTSAGFKRYQEVNRPKFKKKWAKAFAGNGVEGQAPDLEKDRGILGRILFIDYTTPRPDRDAGSYAAMQEIRLVQSLGYKVTFLPANLAHLGAYTDDLQRMGVEVLYAPFHLTMARYLEKHAADFDAFYITRYHVAGVVLDLIRRYAAGRKVMLNNADLHFLREMRAAAGNIDAMEAARTTRTAELEVMEKVDLVLSYSDVEHAVIESHTEGRAQVARCPWIVDCPATIPGIENRAGLSFLGNYKHHPNAEAVAWFARQVMPRLATAQPSLALHVYGSQMPDDIKALRSDLIRPEGYIDDVAAAYDRHRIFVAPLQSGAGIKGKVLAALAHGIPCVLSPLAAEGIGLRHGHDCLIARTPQDWVDAINALTGSDADWTRIAGNGRAYVQDWFSFDRGQGMMRDIFGRVGLPVPPE
jgi:GT2 family glycosyltransferase/glycosyltransferase involved in cell wall biosynthesis